MLENSLIAYLIKGILLGAASGITPGPINALIVSESLKNGSKSGVQIALSPLITDGPIIALALFIVSQLSQIDFLLVVITFCGAAFLIYLGFSDLTKKLDEHKTVNKNSRPLLKGVTANLLTPHPYIFWITIGSPIVIAAYNSGSQYSIAFVVGFYSLLIGFKVFLALFTDRMRKFIMGKSYKITVKLLAIILILFGLLLFFDGIQKLF